MKFKFRINPDYVFLHAINARQKNEPFAGWAKFTNNIWEESPEVFYLLAGAPEYILRSSSLPTIAKKTQGVLKKIRLSKEYRKLIKETREYLVFVEKQWQKNGEQALSILSEISGIELPKVIITVFITHPKLRNGSVVDDNAIVWGHSEDFKNYTTVYLCHELMHIMTKHDPSDITHAVIELMTDNELRIRLNRRGSYFSCPGHAYLRQLEKKLFPAWKTYLKRKDKNILRFIRTMKKKAG